MGGEKVKLAIRNEVGRPLEVYYISPSGEDIGPSPLEADDTMTQNTFVGHCFRLLLARTDILVDELCVQPGTTRHVVGPCDGLAKSSAPLYGEGRDAEFRALLQDSATPCLPASDSARWSCVRYSTAQDVLNRDPELYGFNAKEATRPDVKSGVHGTVDRGYTRQIPRMPRMSTGPGYALMNFTDGLQEVLRDWYEAKRPEAKQHNHIPGGYTNIRDVPMDHLNLDHYPKAHGMIVAEMRQILQWWTGLPLKHTSTFGARIYQRGSMLIDHVDREDTHLVSAVLLFAQKVDVNGGWPLELLLANGTVAEVYAQPGQLILYEGGWLRHGRPMRLRGEEFGNVFSHFAPYDWKGPWSQDYSAAEKYQGVPENRDTTIADEPARYDGGSAESVRRLREAYPVVRPGVQVEL